MTKLHVRRDIFLEPLENRLLFAADDVIVRVIRRDGFEATTRLRLRVDLDRGENSSDHVFGLRRI